MKLRTRIIAGFLAVAIIPMVLMSLLLYVYISSSYENQSYARSQLAVRAFHAFLNHELQNLEESAYLTVENREFLIRALDLPERSTDLAVWLDRRIESGEFEFALARSVSGHEIVKSYSDELAQLIEGYDYPPPLKQEQSGATGLVQLTRGKEAAVAAVAMVPVYHRGSVVAELLVGRVLQDLMGGYEMDLLGLSGLIVVADENVLFARTDQKIANSLPQVASLEVGEGIANVELEETDYLIRGWNITGIAGDEVASVKLLFDTSDYLAGRSKLFRIFVLLLLGAIGFAAIVGVIYSRYLGRPLGEMSEAARQISAGKIPKNVIYLHDDEIGDLVAGINRLTDDLRRTEQQLRQTEQIAAWQMFARQTAHELRNFLMPLATTAAQLQRWAEAGAIDSVRAGQAVAGIHIEIGRMRHLLAAFSEFAKLPPPHFKRVSPEKLLSTLRSAFSEQLSSGALHFAVDGEVPAIRCDPDQIRQVLLNLLSNSYQAGATLVQVRIEGVPEGVQFHVSDDGQGVEPGGDPFAPLYSTKEGGSGLGLAIVRRIVVDHGGDIAYHENSTGGAIFKFLLPGASA